MRRIITLLATVVVAIAMSGWVLAQGPRSGGSEDTAGSADPRRQAWNMPKLLPTHTGSEALRTPKPNKPRTRIKTRTWIRTTTTAKARTRIRTKIKTTTKARQRESTSTTNIPTKLAPPSQLPSAAEADGFFLSHCIGTKVEPFSRRLSGSLAPRTAPALACHGRFPNPRDP